MLQQPLRLIREGLLTVLSNVDTITMVGVYAAPAAVVEGCASTDPDVVVLDLDPGAWEVARIAAKIQRRSPDVRFVGTRASNGDEGDDLQLLRRCGISNVISLSNDAQDLVAAITAAAGQRPLSVTVPPPPSVISAWRLTERELEILHLIGAGFTSREVSNRLDITYKTVENHKQRIFAKLRVQSQAQAVAVALQHGLMTGEAVMALSEPPEQPGDPA